MENIQRYWISASVDNQRTERKYAEFIWLPANSCELWTCDYSHYENAEDKFQPLGKVNRFVPCGPNDPDVLRKCLILFCGNLFQECPSYIKAMEDLENTELVRFDCEDTVPESLKSLIEESRQIQISNKFHLYRGTVEPVEEY